MIETGSLPPLFALSLLYFRDIKEEEGEQGDNSKGWKQVLFGMIHPALIWESGTHHKKGGKLMSR